MSGLCNLVVKNTSPDHATPATKPSSYIGPIPGLPRDQRFDLILLDPPWVNRSVRRSGHYHTQHYLEGDLLTQRIRDILKVHLQDSHRIFRYDTSNDRTSMPKPTEQQTQSCIAAIWITNSAKARKIAFDAIQGAGLSVCEEWIWIKTTTKGDPITPLDGLWRKPYEVLIIGMRRHLQQQANSPGKRGDGVITRRFIAGVPDVHSRKPNLKEVFEKVFFADASPSPMSEDRTAYSALEVFARNLTAGWWACGDEALKFNSKEWWVHGNGMSLS
ncbi:hypothetical protein APSETT444_004500 [Aspergillus pseudonomiae]